MAKRRCWCLAVTVLLALTAGVAPAKKIQGAEGPDGVECPNYGRDVPERRDPRVIFAGRPKPGSAVRWIGLRVGGRNLGGGDA